MTRSRAIFELILAGALWGLGFVATIWGLRAMTPSQFLFLRFFLSFLFAQLMIFLQPRAGGDRIQTSLTTWLYEFRIAWPAGLLLGILILVQTMGLLSISAAESGFITTLYVVFVPLFQQFFFKRKQPVLVFFFAFLALLGVHFLAGGQSRLVLDKGHWLTLTCAILSAFQIIYIGSVGAKIKDPFQFNAVQSFICALLMGALLWREPLPHVYKLMDWLPWTGLFLTVFGSTMIAFTIQVRTQRVLPPTTASMLFLLESPFAAFFGVLFLNEGLTTIQMFGAGVILASSYLTIKFEKP